MSFLKNQFRAIIQWEKPQPNELFYRFTERGDELKNASKLILQEDSGIPYNFFPKENWNIKLYGQYVNPFKIFTDKIYVQENLRSDFKIPEMTTPLPFRLGYHSGTRTDNLMLAIQK